ncbi:uncharacterized protein A4U43_C04F22950 [Asparagus officinalis]|uniref:Uncharacterized protein n=1 Tax=Asparagus officinalis TaxID=4686 RepID=A0A5P1F5S8_ASPOF|nr:uncharacterized protein A4U43_C04F22950 [Asparagus officinalis]
MAPKKAVPRPSKSYIAAAQGSAPSASAGGATAQANVPPQLPLIGVRHTSEPLPFRHYFGHEGGVDLNMTFNLRQELPVFRIKEKSRVELIT